MIKWSMHQNDLIILNVYVPNKTFTKKHKLIELQKEIDKSTIIVDFNTPVSIT